MNDASGAENRLTFVLVRAEETEFARSGRLEGDVDVPLTTAGRSRCQRTLEEIRRDLGGLDAVYAAENQGARETATILAQANSNRVQVLAGLRGISFGVWEGQLVSDVRLRHSRIWESFLRDPTAITPPEGESIARAFDRAGGALKAIRRRHRAGKVAVVASDAVVSLVRCHLSGLPAGELFRVSRQLRRIEIVSPAD